MANLKAWLRRIFGQSEKQEQEEHTAPDIFKKPGTAAETAATLTETPTSPSGEARRHWEASGVFAVGWATDVGRVRDHNEDALFVISSEHEADNAVPVFGLFMLADGMGGHQSGEMASSLALRVAGGHLLSQVYMPLIGGVDRGGTQPSLTDVMREAISQANRVVSRDLPGSGSTLTCAMILGDRLFIGHVGDSRAYLLRVGQPPKQLTKDHSLVNRLMEMGQLTEEEAAIHPQRNVLYRAVGQGGALEIDILTYALVPGDRLLLCSDGLWGFVAEAEIWRLIEQAATPQQACAQLVAAANVAGGNDNITVILVEVWHKPE
ncbi:MAG TPA: protein phosphatase 2C domain-containing protein [Anaerolineae bacterium]|nr:protein phosphatase 2C domain-containing protein [Anaerolineae bacterium]HQI86684.1 protein phosphatase 2C domain-containing protein [Anaerolineae bacterium]HQK13426.1 protein phosphatase 2C domain-containing protein [Anaerolineae bacterium]